VNNTTTSARCIAGVVLCGALLALGCKPKSESPASQSQPAAQNTQDKPPFMSSVAGAPPTVAPADKPPPPDKVDGFDGKRAYDQVAKQLSFGPRPAGSPAIAKLQDYLLSELKSYNCTVDVDVFSSDTPIGSVPMKNIVVKIPGQKPGIILLGTHYDTKRMENFVGADDSGSSTGVMLEIARLLCTQKEPGKYSVWIAFFDAEEAFNLEWKDPDNRYGSRQMAAQMAANGDLPKIKAFILVDLVGGKNPHFLRDGESTPWLKDMVWKVAANLGYSDVFQTPPTNFGGDDHYSFTARHVPSVDIMDLDLKDVPYWHTPQDTLDKISPKTLAIVGHVVLESVKQLQQR
jgi:glutaminyl-peptide cyclotransferase